MHLIDYFENSIYILLLHCTRKYELAGIAIKVAKHKLKIAKPIDYPI